MILFKVEESEPAIPEPMPIENREEREIVINKGSASLGITGTVNL